MILQTTDIGKLVTCPDGNGTLVFMAMGHAEVDLMNGGTWIGPQKDVRVIPEHLVDLAIDDPPPGIGR